METPIDIAKTFLKDVAKQYKVNLDTALTSLLNGFTTEYKGREIKVPAITNKSSIDLLSEAHKQLTNITLF